MGMYRVKRRGRKVVDRTKRKIARLGLDKEEEAAWPMCWTEKKIL